MQYFLEEPDRIKKLVQKTSSLLIKKSLAKLCEGFRIIIGNLIYTELRQL